LEPRETKGKLGE
jgi:DNA-cytosine methyltransferase